MTPEVRDSTNDQISGSTTVEGATISFRPTGAVTGAGSPYTATATARDETTNLLDTVSTWSFSIDVTAPAAPVIASVDADNESPALGRDATPAIAVSGVVTGDTVAIVEGETVLGTKVVADGADSVTFNAGDADDEVDITDGGDHTLAAIATDPVGNASEASTPVVQGLRPRHGRQLPNRCDRHRHRCELHQHRPTGGNGRG